MEHKKATINDVAKSAKVSKTTISRYINQKFHLISLKTQKRIEVAIRNLDYYPSQIAKSMKKGNTKLIAVIFSDINNSYSIDVFQGIEKYATKKGYALLLFNSDNNIEREIKILKLLSSYSVEGIIIQSISSKNYVASLCNIPVVAIDREIKNPSCDLVGLDNEKAMEIIFHHLLENKFNAFLFITEMSKLSQARHIRYSTFKHLSEKYKSIISSSTIEIDNSQDSASLDKLIKRFTENYIHKNKVIISVNSKVSSNIISSLERINIKCGKDIGFISFDNPDWTRLISGGISVLCQPTFKIGYNACKLLLDRINIKSNGQYKKIYYSGILIPRKSTIYIK